MMAARFDREKFARMVAGLVSFFASGTDPGQFARSYIFDLVVPVRLDAEAMVYRTKLRART